MRVLVTGAGGQLAGALRSTCPSDTQLLALSHAELDVGDAQAAHAAVHACRPDVIINTAAYTAVDRAESEPHAAARVNTEGVRNLAAAARDLRCRLIHVSTDYVFDGESGRPYTPESATNPLSVYGRTKLEGERAALELLGAHAAVLRTSWLYSALGSNFMLTMLRLMRERGTVRVVADQIGTPTATASAAQALWRITRLPTVSGVLHWTDAGVASWYDFAVAIAEEARALGLLTGAPTVEPISTRDYPTAARRPAASVLEHAASIASLGLVPRHWRESLRTVLGELKARHFAA